MKVLLFWAIALAFEGLFLFTIGEAFGHQTVFLLAAVYTSISVSWLFAWQRHDKVITTKERIVIAAFAPFFFVLFLLVYAHKRSERRPSRDTERRGRLC